MFIGRIGSLNGLELTRNNPIWNKLIGKVPPSADSVGRIVSQMNTESLRYAHSRLYKKLKRNKAIKSPKHGLVALSIDGHETSCSYKMSCKDCLERERTGDNGIQKYHKNVTAQLVYENFCILIDAEQINPGEGEQTAAKRLYERVVKNYARAFHVVIFDALYGNLPIIELILESKKDFVIVFKSNAGHVFDQAKHILNQKPVEYVKEDKQVRREIKETDEVAFGIKEELMRKLKRNLRVVQSVEYKKKKPEENEPETWMWVTSLATINANSEVVVQIGHSRWKIENQGFNETSNRWFADHVYKHDSNAILNFWLICMLAHNLFMCFFYMNLKITRDQRITTLHVAKMFLCEIYQTRKTLKHSPPT